MRLFTTRAERFRLHIEHERQNGYLLDEATDGKWFVSGPNVSDAKETHSVVLCMYNCKKGLVSKVMAVYDETKNTIFIGDIKSEIENKGYGSIIMTNIIKIAEILKVKTIAGNLAETDSDHFDKLEHFYKKYDFIVKINSSGKTGTIYRKM
jgi:hypothetical protein